VKLGVGLSLVIVMMLTLFGGSLYGLNALHQSYLLLVGQLPELGAATKVLESVMRLEAQSSRFLLPGGQGDLVLRVEAARDSLQTYFNALLTNSSKGNRIDDGRDEFSLVFLIDDDLTAILRHLKEDDAIEPLIERTPIYLSNNPQQNLGAVGPWDANARLQARLDRLRDSASRLPDDLYRDQLALLNNAKGRYLSSRAMVWTGATAVVFMLAGLSRLIHRWVVHPVRLLHRGVRRVGRNQFDYRIDIATGDEMQALAEAFNDMTARLSATYADLERQISERSKQLVRSERLASVGFLAAGVAHEINNPLAAIAFGSEALEMRLGGLLPPDAESSDARTARNYIRMIQEEAFRCKGITERLLDFSRCTEIQRQRVNLVELVQTVADMIRHMGKYKGKTIQFNPREAVFAHADAQEIKQVVLNLVVNAMESMDVGGTLRIEARTVAGQAVLTLRDDGCGMTAEVLENIFEPFFTRRRGGKGTGLGLSITHRIIAQHGGEITAQSQGEGRGSTFEITLPVLPVPRPALDEPSGSGERHRICLPSGEEDLAASATASTRVHSPREATHA
jgi:signal transduction histidine kinase